MSRAQTLATLQTLLERVRSRARVPRPQGDSISADSSEAEGVSRVEEPAAPITWIPPAMEPSEDTSAAQQGLAPVEDAEPADAERGTTQAWTADTEEEPDDEPEEPADEPAVDPSLTPPSRPPMASSVAPIGAAPRDVDVEAPAPDEFNAPEPLEEHAPASSRRPVTAPAEPPLEQLAFGAEEALPPLHTPPPESGRVPAAPDASDFDRSVTGVKAPKSVAPPRLDALGFESPREEIVPQATRATIDHGVAVVHVVGGGKPAPASTFASLLDGALDL